MLESAQQIKKIDLDYYVFNYQWFRVTNIVLDNFQKTNSMILPPKAPPVNPITDYQQKQKTKEKIKIKKNSKHFCKPLLEIIVGVP